MFSYPLTRPWQARAFAKLLNVYRGVTYETLARAIGESPRSLVAWQRGDRNAYIGRMMVARINMPMDELLQDLEGTAIKKLSKNTRLGSGPANTLTVDMKPVGFNRYSTTLTKNKAIDARCSVDTSTSYIESTARSVAFDKSQALSNHTKESTKLFEAKDKVCKNSF